jgi:hypothetical protein
MVLPARLRRYLIVVVTAATSGFAAVTPAMSAPPARSTLVGVASATTNAQFIAASAPSAQQTQRQYRVPASVTLAQAILESGWGRSSLAANDHNYFGMKCFGQGGYATSCRDYATTECSTTGCYPTTASFRVYATVTDSFLDHATLLSTASRYATAMRYTSDPNRFAIEIHKAGYATSPTYSQQLINLMTQYNLYRYDVQGPVPVSVRVPVAAPAAAATRGGLHVVIRDDDGAAQLRTRTGGTWGDWRSLGGVLVDSPGVVAADASSLLVFGQGANHHLYVRTVADSGAVSGWSDLGGLLTSHPAATVSTTGVVRVVARGGDNAAWMRERIGGRWNDWLSLGGELDSGPAATATTAREAIVGAIGGDGALWLRDRAAAWSPWATAGGNLTADPALSATADGTGTVAVVRGGDQGCWIRVGDAEATGWGAWTNLGGSLVSGPAVAVEGTALDVFAFGRDGRLWQNVAADGAGATGWSGWQPLP